MHNYTLSILENNKEVSIVSTHAKRRFYTHLASINWQHGGIKTYLRISYGKKKCSKGCKCIFYNAGWYVNKKDLHYAVKCFTEN